MLNITKKTKKGCKKAREIYQNITEEENWKKSGNIIVNSIKIFSNMKNKSWLNIGKIILKSGKKLHHNRGI